MYICTYVCIYFELLHASFQAPLSKALHCVFYRLQFVCVSMHACMYVRNLCCCTSPWNTIYRRFQQPECLCMFICLYMCTHGYTFMMTHTQKMHIYVYVCYTVIHKYICKYFIENQSYTYKHISNICVNIQEYALIFWTKHMHRGRRSYLMNMILAARFHNESCKARCSLRCTVVEKHPDVFVCECIYMCVCMCVYIYMFVLYIYIYIYIYIRQDALVDSES